MLADSSFFPLLSSSSENSLLMNQLTGHITTDLAAVLPQRSPRLPSGVMLDNQPFYMKNHVEKSKLVTCKATEFTSAMAGRNLASGSYFCSCLSLVQKKSTG